jgi:P4 family phage/plasmid primase-like protien
MPLDIKSAIDIAKQYYEEYGFLSIPVKTLRLFKPDLTDQEKENLLKKAKHPVLSGWLETNSNNYIENIKNAFEYYRKMGQREIINLGAVTGKNYNKFVVDVDIKNNGMETWDQLIGDNIIDTMRVKTRSGGYHYHFEYDERLDMFSNISEAIEFNGKKVGIDFRTDGGFIIIPPSEYDGKKYLMDIETSPKKMPDWLFLKLKEHYSKKPIQPSLMVQPQNKIKINLKSNLSGCHYSKEEIRELVDLLKWEDFEGYDDWLHLGMCIRNLNIDWIDIWIDFSKQSSKYKEGECEKRWKTFTTNRKNLLSIGSLINWVKKADPEQLKLWRNKTIDHLLSKTLSRTSQDFSVLLHNLVLDHFVHVGKGVWYYFEKHRWNEDDGDELLSKIKELMDPLYETRIAELETNLYQIPPTDQAAINRVSKLLDLYRKAYTEIKDITTKNKILSECKILLKDVKFEEKMDMNPHLLGFENGIYDLHNGIFRDGKPEDLVSLSTGYDYVEHTGEETVFQQILIFLKQLFGCPEDVESNELLDYIMPLMSSFLEGKNPREKIYFFNGTGGNGKSKLVTLLMHALGKYAKNMPTAVLTELKKSSQSASPYLADLRGCRFLSIQEPAKGDRLNMGLVKEMTGNDLVSCRRLYKHPITFKMICKMVYCCNHLPEVDADDDATWRRIVVILFKSKFTENPDPQNPNEFIRDEHLEDKLFEWKGAFMSLLLDCYKQYKIQGLKEPKEVLSETNKYRENVDSVQSWVNDNLTKLSSEDCLDKLGNPIFEQYKDIWALWKDPKNELCDKKIKRAEFLELIEKKLSIKHKKSLRVGKKEYSSVFIGIQIRTEDDIDSDDSIPLLNL